MARRPVGRAAYSGKVPRASAPQSERAHELTGDKEEVQSASAGRNGCRHDAEERGGGGG